MREPRFSCHPQEDGQIIFEIRDGDRDFVGDCDELLAWLRTRFGEPIEQFVRDETGAYVLVNNGVYELRPFHVHFVPGRTTEAMDFRLRWC